ncbi:RNA 2',3'-cyclic phosphodiesterase [Natrinema longum]|uniref:RNA 2',3'-cyclic phosphodiesterase n=1 Tax=Natrinema longum TaxID=370324 RepID=A0A8A2U568_9EURY|nr:RNA 2',3'-cyclic phosphodiesterase [Natrinema longum]MBZ6494830.1 RNA 2',3'-cyclic phosphodiesterase [Natrinema longum]QSW83866.1 RNA 2',3'-cyclic phosphodiesterase [Natrinema longum]
MRLFVSVDLPDDLADPVADLQAEFADASGLDFTDPEQAHVTLKFLGDVNADRLPALERALEAAVDDAGVDPFPVRYGGLGVFPSLEYISVVWLGVERGGDELTRLHEAIEDRTTAMGFDAEDHDFTPHVTLARMEHAGGKELVQDLVREREPTIGEDRVDEIRLTESTLTDDGPVYSTVESFPL